MYFRKSTTLISLGSILISFCWLLIRKQLSWANLSDTLFFFTLFLLIIGVFLWVCSSGSFDFFQYSLKKAFGKDKESYLKLSDVGRTSYRFWLEPALLLFICSMLALGIATIF